MKMSHVHSYMNMWIYWFIFSMCFSNVATYDEIRNVVYWAVTFFTLASKKLFQIHEMLIR